MAKESASSSSGGAPSWGLVVIRLYIGWFFMSAGWMKVTSGVGSELVTGTKERINAAPDWYRWFGNDVVLEWPSLFAFLIQWGELIGGVCLFLGVLTRPVCAAFAFMLLNFYFAGPAEAQTVVKLIAVCVVALFLSRAGRRMGVDAMLDTQLPKWISW